MKPYIKICTPFYNEWQMQHHSAGTVTPIRNNPPLSIEHSIDKLAQMDGVDQYECGMVIETPEFAFRWVRVRGTYIARSRNALVNDNASNAVKQKIEAPYTHYLFIDSDIEFEYTDIVKLLKADLPIVSGCYQERTHSTCYTGGWFDDDGYLDFIGIDKRGLKEVDWCGAGFMLVKKEVFETIPYKWFDCSDFKWTDEDGIERIDSYEDDTTFCINAHDAGYKIWLDCDCTVKHHLINKPKEAKMDRIKELKAFVYDNLAQRDYINIQIDKANQEIAQLMQAERAKQPVETQESAPKGE